MPKFSSANLRKGNARLILLAIITVVILVGIALATGLLKFNVNISKADESESASSSDKKAPVKNETVSYVSDKYGFTLKYPESWSVTAGTTSDPVVTFLSQKENSEDKFKENLFVTVTDLSSKPGLSSSEVMDMWIKENKAGAYSATFDILSQKSTTVDSLSAEQVTYTFTASGYDIKGMITIVMKNNKAHLLSYSAETKSFDTFSKEVTALINSFVIL